MWLCYEVQICNIFAVNDPGVPVWSKLQIFNKQLSYVIPADV